MMSQIPQSKLKKVQKIYVEILDEFLNLSMSDVQVKHWTVVLAKYDDAVLLEGWDEFVNKVRPGLMPSVTDCTDIMDRIRLEHTREIHNATKAPIERTEDNSGIHDWIQATLYGMGKVRTGIWNESDRLSHLIDTAREMHMDGKSIRQLKIAKTKWKRNNPNVNESPI